MDNANNYRGEVPAVDKSYLTVNKCSKDSPYFDGKICLKCQLPNYFDFKTNRCYSCAYRYQFSTEDKKCNPIKLKTGYKNNYLVDVDNFAGPIPTYDSLYETCVAATPFFNG